MQPCMPGRRAGYAITAQRAVIHSVIGRRGGSWTQCCAGSSRGAPTANRINSAIGPALDPPPRQRCSIRCRRPDRLAADRATDSTQLGDSHNRVHSELGSPAKLPSGILDFVRPIVCTALTIACFTASSVPWNRAMAQAASPGGWASVSVAATTKPQKAPLLTALQYRIQKIMLMKLGGKLFAVLLVSLPVVLFGGVAYRWATGNPWYLSFFRAYLLTGCVPGCDTIEDNNQGTIVTNIIYLLGLLTFAVLVGVVCNDISTVVNNVRSGNTDVVEEGHTVILNANKQLPSVLRQMSTAKQERRHGTFVKPVVVLADLEKKELDAIVKRSLNGSQLDVYTRHGLAHSPSDLQRVAADQADTIVLLQPEHEDSATTAAKRAATIASLKAMGTGDFKKTHMVVQTPESKTTMEGLTNVNMAAQTPPLPKESKLRVVEMHAAQNLDRMVAQCSLQPGLGTVYSEILEQGEGMEFYVTSYPSLAGKPYFTVRRHFGSAAVCGYLKNETLTLNPSENDEYGPDDYIVLLAPSFDKTKPLSKPLPAGADWVKNVKRSYKENVSKKIMILNWCGQCGGVLESLDQFAPKGTKVTLVSSEKSPLASRFKGIRVSHFEGNPASSQVLEKAGLDACDSVIITGVNALDADTADAQVLSTVLQIEDLTRKNGCEKPLHVVASINHPTTKDVVNHLNREAQKTGSWCTLDMLLPDELSSGVLTQVAAQPRLLHVVRDLMNPSDIELYIREPTDYELLGKGHIMWKDVAEVARANGETAVGYIDKDGKNHTAPEATSSHVFEEADKVVVLAKDYAPV